MVIKARKRGASGGGGGGVNSVGYAFNIEDTFNASTTEYAGPSSGNLNSAEVTRQFAVSRAGTLRTFSYYTRAWSASQTATVRCRVNGADVGAAIIVDSAGTFTITLSEVLAVGDLLSFSLTWPSSVDGTVRSNGAGWVMDIT